MNDNQNVAETLSALTEAQRHALNAAIAAEARIRMNLDEAERQRRDAEGRFATGRMHGTVERKLRERGIVKAWGILTPFGVEVATAAHDGITANELADRWSSDQRERVDERQAGIDALPDALSSARTLSRMGGLTIRERLLDSIKHDPHGHRGAEIRLTVEDLQALADHLGLTEHDAKAEAEARVEALDRGDH